MDLFDDLVVDSQQDTTLANQLKQQLTWLIANGKLQAGDRLPSIHLMADRLGINLHTVRSAYKKLEEEGLVETRQGRGTHVLAFDPSRMAQAAGKLRSHTVGVIIPSWTNPFYHGFLQGVEQVAEEDQALLFLCNSHDNAQTAWRDFARLTAKQVDGILVASHDMSRILSPEAGQLEQPGEIPIVVADWPGYAGYSLLIDLEQAGYLATHHLVEHGHRRVGLISVVQEAANISPVKRGYTRAMAEHDLPADSKLTVRVNSFNIASGADGARKLLRLKNPPTAIFAISDMLALGAMTAIKEAGLRIPADIALVGFNDIPTAALVEPKLTTVAAPVVQLGIEAMKMLQILIGGKQPARRQITLPASLVVRESCGCHEKR